MSSLKPKKDNLPLTDKISCAKRSKELREKYKSPCGICIKVCPIGEDRELFSRKNMDIYSSKNGFKKYKKAWNHVRSYEVMNN